MRLASPLICYNVPKHGRGAAMARRWVGRAMAMGLFGGSSAALAQSEPAATPAVDPALGITVTATRLDETRSSIQPSLGATKYDFSQPLIETVPLGENAPLNQVL